MCSMKRVIFHIDVNSAYLSWEAVSRLAAGDTVDLREIPSAVGGDVETRHGTFASAWIGLLGAKAVAGVGVFRFFFRP